MQQPKLPSDVSFILEQLNAHGFEAYIVGGCVRDCILGRTPQDWDITTSAMPEETKAVFSHTFDTGIQHGTITVVLNHINYEITTYRIDGAYADNRHPQEVFFTASLQEDLLRRDFTMNAIAYHPTSGYQDPYHGIEDITIQTIRGVGDAALRFQEDALRMLRCVRFGAQLGFKIEQATYDALCVHAPLIKNISVERIKVELDKLWLAPFIFAMPHLWNSGLLAEFDEKLSAHLKNNDDALLLAMESAPTDLALRWGLVLSGYTVKEAKALMKKLKCDTATMKDVCLFVELSPLDVPTEPYPLRVLAGKVGVVFLRRLLLLQGALRPDSGWQGATSLLESIISANDCLTLKDMAIGGDDLIALGVPNGRRLGGILTQLLDEVHREPLKNERGILTEIVRSMLADDMKQ